MCVLFVRFQFNLFCVCRFIHRPRLGSVNLSHSVCAKKNYLSFFSHCAFRNKDLATEISLKEEKNNNKPCDCCSQNLLCKHALVNVAVGWRARIITKCMCELLLSNNKPNHPTTLCVVLFCDACIKHLIRNTVPVCVRQRARERKKKSRRTKIKTNKN